MTDKILGDGEQFPWKKEGIENWTDEGFEEMDWTDERICEFNLDTIAAFMNRYQNHRSQTLIEIIEMYAARSEGRGTCEQQRRYKDLLALKDHWMAFPPKKARLTDLVRV